MSKLASFAVFVAGAAIGSAATWYYAKKKYEQIAQEEIEQVKNRFSYLKTGEQIVEETEETEDNAETIDEDTAKKVREMADKAKEKPSVAEYAKKLSKEGYTDYSNSGATDDEESDDPGPNKKYFGDAKSIPYVIPPEEFGDLDEYDQISLTYYSDHMLADENDELVEDVENAVGFESLNHFGEYEDDSVFVRNDRLKVDYEILLDQRTYTDVIKTKPYLKEG